MKNKYKVIESGYSGLICDNPKCNYEDNFIIPPNELRDHINRACPECGDNLLTENDCNHHTSLLKVINIINVVCFPFMFLKGGKKEKDTKCITYHHHAGKTTIEECD